MQPGEPPVVLLPAELIDKPEAEQVFVAARALIHLAGGTELVANRDPRSLAT